MGFWWQWGRASFIFHTAMIIFSRTNRKPWIVVVCMLKAVSAAHCLCHHTHIAFSSLVCPWSVLQVFVELCGSLLLSVDRWLGWCMVKGAENWRRDKRWLYCSAILMHHVRHDFSQVPHQSEMCTDGWYRIEECWKEIWLASKESWRQLLN